MKVNPQPVDKVTDEEQLEIINICRGISEQFLCNKSAYELSSIFMNLIGNFLTSIPDIKARKLVSKNLLSYMVEIIGHANGVEKE